MIVSSSLCSIKAGLTAGASSSCPRLRCIQSSLRGSPGAPRRGQLTRDDMVGAMDLRNAIQTRALGVDTVPTVLNTLLPAMIVRFNSEVAPRLLSRLPSEELPTTPKAASSFRSRVSLLVEYSLIEMMADFLNEDSPGLNVTYNTTNEFADFFIRDDAWGIELRVDVKTLHDLSDEASARYTELQSDISEHDDYLLYVAWQWKTTEYHGPKLVVPAVIGGVFIPGIEVAIERDLHRILSGGSFDLSGNPLAKSGLRDTNFGKINRIVHASRRMSSDLSPRLQELLRLFDRQAIARAEAPAAMKAVEELADSEPVAADTDAV